MEKKTSKSLKTSREREISHNSIEKNTAAERVRSKEKQIFDEYLNVCTWQVNIVTKELAAKLGKEFYEWATNDAPGKKAYKVCDFYIKRGMPRRDFYRLIERYPEFKELYLLGVEAIGARREQGALGAEEYKPLNERIVAYTASHYDQDWKDLDKYHDDRKIKVTNDSAKEGGNTVIVGIPVYEDKKTPEEVAKEARNRMKGIEGPK